MRQCIHYTGILKYECRAEVRYAVIAREQDDPSRGVQWGIANRIPCLERNLAGGDGTCPHRHFPTQEEEDERERRQAAAVVRLLAAFAAIQEDMERRGETRSTSGEVACPTCEGGTIRYSAASNGHVQASCSTAGCVAFIE